MLEQLAIYNPDTSEKLCIVLIVALVFFTGYYIGRLVRLESYDDRQLETDMPWMDAEKAREARENDDYNIQNGV
jgi:hypothetical protein